MQAKICSSLAVLVLLAALAFGNPFLPAERRGAASPGDAVPGDAVPVLGDRVLWDRVLGNPALGEQVAGNHAPSACPEPELARAVVAVRRAADGTWLWCLEDGRVLRRAAGGGAEFLDANTGAPAVLAAEGAADEPGGRGDSAATMSR